MGEMFVVDLSRVPLLSSFHGQTDERGRVWFQAKSGRRGLSVQRTASPGRIACHAPNAKGRTGQALHGPRSSGSTASTSATRSEEGALTIQSLGPPHLHCTTYLLVCFCVVTHTHSTTATVGNRC